MQNTRIGWTKIHWFFQMKIANLYNVLLTIFAFPFKIKHLQRSRYQRQESLIKTRWVGHGCKVNTQINYSYTTRCTCCRHVMSWQQCTFAQTTLWVVVMWLISRHVAYFPCVNYKGGLGILCQFWTRFASFRCLNGFRCKWYKRDLELMVWNMTIKFNWILMNLIRSG